MHEALQREARCGCGPRGTPSFRSSGGLLGHRMLRSSTAGSSSSSKCCSALWSRQPDDLDMQWEREEAARRQQMQQRDLVQETVREATWRQQVDQVHQQLLDQQKHKAALRERLQQDAQRAKREQLRRIEPVAKARARANGLASLGLDPQIMALSEKFGRLSSLVDEVQQRVGAQYELLGSIDDAAVLGQIPAAARQPYAAMAWGAGSRIPNSQQPALHSPPQQGEFYQPQQQEPVQWQQQPEPNAVPPQPILAAPTSRTAMAPQHSSTAPQLPKQPSAAQRVRSQWRQQQQQQSAIVQAVPAPTWPQQQQPSSGYRSPL